MKITYKILMVPLDFLCVINEQASHKPHPGKLCPTVISMVLYT